MDDIKTLPPNEQVKQMVDWFRINYEDPVESMPWDDGDYVWLVPACNATDELSEKFDGVDPELIERAVEIIEEDGWEWVSIADLDKMQD